MTNFAEITRLARKAIEAENLFKDSLLYETANAGRHLIVARSTFSETASPSAWLAMAKRCEELQEALATHNSLLRSACAISEREGTQTNWEAFRNAVKKELTINHELALAAMNEVRNALKGGE